jgi:uncharacterized protein (DUF58 family)
VEIDRSLVQRFHRLRLVAPSFASGHRNGERRARATGHGMEFADYRHYQDGDDLRRVDWNAWTRLNVLLVRMFHADRNLNIHIHLDASGSMGVGKPRRIDFAGNLALTLAAIGLSQRDTVRMCCFGAAQGRNMRLVNGHDNRTLGRMIAQMSRVEPGGEVVDIRRAILINAGGRRSDRAFLISDLLLEDDQMQRAIRALSATSARPVLLHIVGGDGLTAETPGSLELRDAETGLSRFLEMTPALHVAYREQVTVWRAKVERLCARYRVQYLVATCDAPIDSLITHTLRRAAVVE